LPPLQNLMAPPSILRRGRCACVVRLGTPLERIESELVALAFRLEPCLPLAHQLADLGEPLLVPRALALERLDPVEPVDDCPCFVHVPNVAAESRPERVGFVTITRQP